MIQDKSLLQNLTYTTLLSLDNGKATGSGFLFHANNTDFLVTAKHVLFDDDVLRYKSINVSSLNYNDSIRAMLSFEIVEIEEQLILRNQKDDIAIIPLGNIQEGQYNDYVTINQNTPFTIRESQIRHLEDLKIANDVFLMGFPTSLKFEGLDHFHPAIPLLRKGIIAGIYVLDRIFIIDCSVYYGNSGSPVLELGEDHILRLAGVVSRYIPFVIEWRNTRERAITQKDYFNSGYTVCISIDVVLNLITQ